MLEVLYFMFFSYIANVGMQVDSDLTKDFFNQYLKTFYLLNDQKHCKLKIV